MRGNIIRHEKVYIRGCSARMKLSDKMSVMSLCQRFKRRCKSFVSWRRCRESLNGVELLALATVTVTLVVGAGLGLSASFGVILSMFVIGGVLMVTGCCILNCYEIMIKCKRG